MRISLAIATLGRTTQLERLLESLCAQQYTDFEVLVADQNPAGFLDVLLARYVPRLHLHHIHMQSRGVSAARNALLPYCTGHVLAFPDDDCWYAPDTLHAVAAFFAAQPAPCTVLGTWSHSMGTVAALARPAPVTHLYDMFVRSETFVQFYHRSIVEAVGDFDPVLGPGTGLPYGCGEDTDYLLRAAAHGPVWRVPAVRVVHPQQEQGSALNISKVRAYARGRMFLLQKHRLPLWFRVANVLYPLWRGLREGPSAWRYRWYMFTARLGVLGSIRK